MKIICEKGHDARMMMEILYDFLLRETGEYPILKDDMVIEITLKNDIKQINPNNEREFYLGQKEIDEKQEYEDDYYHSILEENWRLFANTSTVILERDIETAKNYIATASENNRKPENVEKRKKELMKLEKRLQKEKEKAMKLQPFIRMVEKGDVEYKYICNEYGQKIKAMLFEVDGKSYMFKYLSDSFGECYICDSDGNVVIDN